MNPPYPRSDGPTVPYGGPPAPPPRRRWWLWGGVGCVALVVLVVLALAVFGFYVHWAWLVSPPTPGRQVPARVIQKIRDLGLLERDEELRYLASDGTFRIEEDLSFFTQRRLVLHCEEWETPTCAVNLRDIASITPSFAESDLDYTCLAVVCEDGTELTVTLQTDAGGDKRYYEALKRAWEAARTGAKTAPTKGK